MKAEEIIENILNDEMKTDIGFQELKADYHYAATRARKEELIRIKEHFIKVSKRRIEEYEKFIRGISEQ